MRISDWSSDVCSSDLGLLITDQPIFKAGDVVAGTTLVDSNTDGAIDADDHAFMADIGVRVTLDASDIITHDSENDEVLWVQGNEGAVVNLIDTDGEGEKAWTHEGTNHDMSTSTRRGGGRHRDTD